MIVKELLQSTGILEGDKVTSSKRILGTRGAVRALVNCVTTSLIVFLALCFRVFHGKDLGAGTGKV